MPVRFLGFNIGELFSLPFLLTISFRCSVREGMVFASMEQDDLFNRTAQYQIQYLPRNHRRGAVYVGRQGDGQARAASQPLRAYSYSDEDEDDNGGEDDDEPEEPRSAQIPPEFTTFRHPFNVTTEHSEDEDDEEGRASHARPPPRRAPNRIGTLPFESDSDDDDDDEEEEESIQIFGGPYRHWPPENAPLTQTTRIRRRYRHPRPRNAAATSQSSNANNADLNNSSGRGSESNNTTPNYNPNTNLNTSGATGSGGRMTLDEAREASQLATQEAVRAVGGELMEPLAHFFIEQHNNKWTVRFDPPISGRYLLLKLWSPHLDPSRGAMSERVFAESIPQRNIDIQAVVAKGFAGPRLCPVEELA